MTAQARLAVLALAALLLTGCTGGGSGAETDEPTAAGTGTAGTEATGPGTETTGPGTATVADQVMAEQATATPGGLGGEMTLTLRSVEVGGGNMTVRWALRWDDDAAAQDATVNYHELGISPATLVTDRAALTAYRPYCTEGAWQPEDASAVERALVTQDCARTMLVSPLDRVFFKFPNHGTIESWAILPAPESRPETVDVAPVDGLPLFTDATVTYLDGAE
ncbi:hypothetical protein [Xylanimonas cellulosilytica]|nr:hypothetical protein [Xylanimonas cellulosilytica]